MYEIFDLGEKQNVVFSVNSSMQKQFSCGVKHKNDNIENTQELTRQNSDSDCVVKIAVFYTNAAMAVGDPRNKAILDIEILNQIICNSDANTRIELAVVSPLPSINEITIGNAAQTLDAFKVDNEAAEIIEDSGAQMAVIYTGGTWSQPTGLATIETWAKEGEMFALVQINAPSNSYTFPHEVAHLFGCKHEDNNDGLPDFVFKARAHSFKIGFLNLANKRYTVMSTSNTNIIPHFSNPDVDFSGRRTGTGKRDNADQFDDFGCIIGEPETPVSPPINVRTTGPRCGDNSESYEICANLSGCENPTNYFWEYSTDGFFYQNWPNPISNPLNDCITVTLSNDNNLWLRVTVTCDDGETATGFHFIANKDRDCKIDIENIAPIASLPKLNDDVFKGNDKLIVYPNPVADQILINLVITKTSHLRIDILDINGQNVYNIENQFTQSGTYSTTQNLSFLQPGIYFIKTEVNDCIKITKIIKQ